MNKKKIIIIIVALLIVGLSVIIVKNVFLSSEEKPIEKPPVEIVKDKENDKKPINENTNNIQCDICTIDSNEDNVNNSDLIKKEFVVDEFTFGNIKIVSHKSNYNTAELSFEIKNNANSEKKNETFSFSFYDKDGNLKCTLLYVIDKIAANSNINTKKEFEQRIIDSYSVRIDKAIVAGY